MPDTALTYADMTHEQDGQIWPFVESERCDITGYGHQDKAKFAAAVNAWEHLANPDAGGWTADDIAHLWVKITGDRGDWSARPVPRDTPGAVPVTTLCGQR